MMDCKDVLCQRKGFTLLEGILTIVLLVVGVAVVFRLFSVSYAADGSMDYSAIALNLCQEEMETIRDESIYADIDTYAIARTAMTGDFSDFDKEVTVAGDPKQVNVIVYWDDKGQEQSVELVSLFADY